MKGLRLHLVAGCQNPLHGIWNDLILAHHPCGDAPLVGAQLRYLICSYHGWLGAIGVGPAGRSERGVYAASTPDIAEASGTVPASRTGCAEAA
jgi:hypothetical protein